MLRRLFQGMASHKTTDRVVVGTGIDEVTHSVLRDKKNGLIRNGKLKPADLKIYISKSLNIKKKCRDLR